MSRELEHAEQEIRSGDLVRLRFPGDEFADVVVVSVDGDRLLIDVEGLILEFERVMVPFDLKDTALGDVCGELKMWKSVAFPDSAPAMVVANLGRP